MITFCTLLIGGFIFYLAYYLSQMFLKGAPLLLVGVVLALVFIVLALRTLHLISV